MSTSAQVRAHLQEFKTTVADAMATVDDYQNHGTQYTSGNQASERAKITTVRAALLHANDCSICTQWDGS
jgi:hypothetical protein